MKFWDYFMAFIYIYFLSMSNSCWSIATYLRVNSIELNKIYFWADMYTMLNSKLTTPIKINRMTNIQSIFNKIWKIL